MAYKPETKYAYYIRGRNLALVEWKDGKWVSPTTQIPNGLMMEFSVIPLIPTNESSDLDVSETLAQALIAYLKSKRFEQMGEMEAMMFYHKEFLKWVDIDSNNKMKAVRKVTPTFSSAIK